MDNERTIGIMQEGIAELKYKRDEISSGDLQCYYQGGMDALWMCILKIQGIADEKGK